MKVNTFLLLKNTTKIGKLIKMKEDAIFRQIQDCERLRDAFYPKKGFFFLRWHQGRRFESQHSLAVQRHASKKSI